MTIAWRTGLLLLGAALLLIASVAIVVGALRGAPSSAPSASATIPAATVMVPVTTARAIATASDASPTHPLTTTATTTRTAALANPQATVPRATAATPTLPTVANGGCAMSLPGGYQADPAQSGYYPARDRTGFVALDSFVGANQTPAVLAQSFESVTLIHALIDYQQIGATGLADRYRIDYRATSNGQSGRGSTQVQVFGDIGCGVTVFALDGATGPLADTFDLLVRSLGPVQAPRTATATP